MEARSRYYAEPDAMATRARRFRDDADLIGDHLLRTSSPEPLVMRPQTDAQAAKSRRKASASASGAGNEEVDVGYAVNWASRKNTGSRAHRGARLRPSLGPARRDARRPARAAPSKHDGLPRRKSHDVISHACPVRERRVRG